MIIGVVVGVIVALRKSAKISVERINQPDGSITLQLRRDGTFLIKPALVAAFDTIPSGSRVTFDGKDEPLDQDVREEIANFIDDARNLDIHVTLVGVDLAGATAGAGH